MEQQLVGGEARPGEGSRSSAVVVAARGQDRQEAAWKAWRGGAAQRTAAGTGRRALSGLARLDRLARQDRPGRGQACPRPGRSGAGPVGPGRARASGCARSCRSLAGRGRGYL